MSRENVELVRRIYEAAVGRDDVTAYELYSEDIVWDLTGTTRAALLAQPVYHGHEGVRQVWRDHVASFADIDFVVEEMREAGDKVLATVRERDVGRSSGVTVHALHFTVWTLADGKAIRLQVFDEREAAEEAAGLLAG